MTADNFNRTLRTFQRRTPFRAFTVELVSGDRVQVDHPEAMVIRAGVGVYIARDGEISLFDHEGVSQVIGESTQQSA